MTLFSDALIGRAIFVSVSIKLYKLADFTTLLETFLGDRGFITINRRPQHVWKD
jgi:hypothetical protein